MFLFVCMLLHLYATHAWPAVAKSTVANGHLANGHAVDGRRVRDAEEFELEGLMSDDDDETPKPGARAANGRAA